VEKGGELSEIVVLLGGLYPVLRKAGEAKRLWFEEVAAAGPGVPEK
jgi:hypothetical protein